MLLNFGELIIPLMLIKSSASFQHPITISITEIIHSLPVTGWNIVYTCARYRYHQCGKIITIGLHVK